MSCFKQRLCFSSKFRPRFENVVAVVVLNGANTNTMKKIRTYGKHKQREIRLDLFDKWDEISDEGEQKQSCASFLYNGTNGWTRIPKSIPYQSPLKQNDSNSISNDSRMHLASTPYAKEDVISCDNLCEVSEIEDPVNLDKCESLVLFSHYDDSNNSLNQQEHTSKDQLAEKLCRSLISRHVSRLSHSRENTPNDGKTTLSFLEAVTPIDPEESRESIHNLIANDSFYRTSAEQKVLRLCEQERILHIDEYITQKMSMSMKKIGEGLYGEVFEAINQDRERVAVKIVPVEGDLLVNGERQKTFEEIIPEIAISKELSGLFTKDDNCNHAESFIHVHRTICCQGAYPENLIHEWEKWGEEHESENDSPEHFQEEQIFVIFEAEFAGQSLEDFPLSTAAEAKSLLYQVTAALAVGEHALQFEHRDLHWGNVLVRRTDEQSASFQIEGECIEVPTSGIKISLIDFTLSRLAKDGCVVYCNLSNDPTLFDGKDDYQFDIYRKMKEENGNSWEGFCPRTNVLWLHYLADKLIKMKLKRANKYLKDFFESILSYQSAFDVLQDEYFVT